ncbi:MAG: excinuclease ABC subunit UvrC [Candidatus Heimdallarchaeota archaeon]|nr:MAG: excinuclease ABC subunit UvrC [Candidatus Heimdallarchaeota archaeon]
MTTEDKDNLLLRIKSFPDKPGIYSFKDDKGKVIYIGKAKSLKKRITSYFVEGALDKKTLSMKRLARDVEFIVTNTETDALILENSLIKLHKPKLNVRLKDDKTYPYLKITSSEKYPRVEIIRNREDNDDLYFGPYTDVKTLRIALKKALTIFPIARCKKPIIDGKVDRSCLFFQLDRCLAPCVDKIDQKNYLKAVKQFIKLFEGKQRELTKELREEMQEASKQLNYEKAALLRDKVLALEKLVQKQTIISKDVNAEYDLIGLYQTQKMSLAQILAMRQGRITEQKHFVMDLPYDLNEDEILTSFIKQYYSKTDFIPKRILTKIEIDDEITINSWLKEKRKLESNELVLVRPKTSEQKAFIELAYSNAKTNYHTIIKVQKLREEKISEGLQELKDVLDLKEEPKRIEGYDVSTLLGTDTVGSCVVFENGLPRKKDYRKFIIKTVEGQDDYASMREMIKRRFTGSLAKKDPNPDLILIDGGPGQISSVLSVFIEINKNIPIIGLSKEFEEIHFTDDRNSIILDEKSEALKVLQRVRDEAHRFAVSFHRQRRTKKMIKSSLEEIPNLGEKRIKMLLGHFGSIENIKNASVDELEKVKGISQKLASEIFEYYSKNELTFS